MPKLIAFVLSLWIAALIGRSTVSAPPAPPESSSTSPEPRPTRSARHHEPRRAVPAAALAIAERPAPIEAAKPESDALERKRQSQELFGLLNFHIMRGIATNRDNPEGAANRVNEYLTGWIDSVAHAAPQLKPELAAEIEQSLCSEDTRPAALIVATRMLVRMPELASEKGFDCVVARRNGEDIVLWSALDAWRTSGLPKTHEISAVERSASDPRTLRRLIPLEEERRQLTAQLAASQEDTETEEP